MCSPIGHSIAALSIGVSSHQQTLHWPYLVFCAFSGIVPDLDFLVGWYFGDINGYHHQLSHSVFAAVIYGVSVYMVMSVYRSGNRSRLRMAFIGFVIYASHVVLDLFTTDNSAPFGMWLWWPVSEEYVISSLTPFRSVQHDVSGNSMIDFVNGLFSMHNLWTVVVEIVILSPFYAICHYRRCASKLSSN